MINFKYHIASGHVVAKIIADDLSIYEDKGYAFVETTATFGDHYVDNGVVKPRVKLTGVNVKLNAITGSSRTIDGLPADAWFTVDGSVPRPVVNNNLVVDHIEGEIDCVVEYAGKYLGPGWRVVWEDLPALLENAKISVDRAAELARTRIITPGSGQAMTYLRKADAARSYLAGAAISDAQMLRLTEEANLTGQSLTEVSTSIVAMADQWENLDAQIDAIRLRSKQDLSTATSGEQIESIYGAIVWPV